MLHDIDVLSRPQTIMPIKSVRFFNPSMESSQLLFTRILHRLLTGGIPLLTALKKLRQSLPDKRWKEMILRLEFNLSEGQPLSECLFYQSRNSNVEFFPYFYVQMIRAGEETGKLEKILFALENYLAKRIERKKKMIEACAYPALVFLMGIAAIIVLLKWVIPQIARVYDGLNVSMPVSTRILVNLGQISFIWVTLIILALAFILKKTRFGWFLWTKMISKRPLKTIFDYEQLNHFSFLLAIHLQSGIPIIHALDSCGKVFSASVSQVIKEVKLDISQGQEIHKSLKRISWIDDSSHALLEAGEISGRLEESLFKIAEDSALNFDASLNWLVKLLEPLLIIVIGALIGSLVLGVLLPILNLQEAMK